MKAAVVVPEYQTEAHAEVRRKLTDAVRWRSAAILTRAQAEWLLAVIDAAIAVCEMCETTKTEEGLPNEDQATAEREH